MISTHALGKQAAFNANKLPPAEVGRLFVRSAHLDVLASTDNVIITGPRGSGKTTLLKMMTRQALDAWEDDLAREILAKPVLSFYIGLDRVRRSQLEAAESRVPDHSSSSLRTVRRIHLGLDVLDAILESILYELERGRARLDPVQAEEAIREMGVMYRLDPVFPTLEALRKAASVTLTEASRAVLRAADGDAALADAIAGAHALPSLADSVIGLHRAMSRYVRGLPSKWVLLFDELEYLQEASRQEVLDLMRELPDYFGLKLAVTPLSLSGDYLQKVEGLYLHAGHEFKPISLGYQETPEILRFAGELHRKVLTRALSGRTPAGTEVDLKNMFGVSYFAPDEAAYRAIYPEVMGRPSDFEALSELCQLDVRVAAYAEARSIESRSGFDALSDNQRASYVRKALPVILLWMERLRREPTETEPEPSSLVKRGRKTRRVYSGYPTFLLLGDGNPRVMLNMLNELLAKEGDTTRQPTGSIGEPVFAPELQSDVLWFGRDEQVSLANAYLSRHGEVVPGLFALELLQLIGQLFEQNVYFGESFNPDPATSFKVDRELSEGLNAAIVDMVYTGALVDLSTEAEIGASAKSIRPGLSVEGRRFRLSYLLAAEHWLPIRKGRKQSLTTLLKRAGLASRGPVEQVLQQRIL